MDGSVRKSGMQTETTIYNQRSQVMEFTHHTVIMARTQEKLWNVFWKLEMCTKDNRKTKGMRLGKTTWTQQYKKIPKTVDFVYYLKKVRKYNYCGVEITNTAEEMKRIQDRINKATRFLEGIMHKIKGQLFQEIKKK